MPRESGIAITIKGFIPIAKGSLSEQAAALQKIDTAIKSGNAALVAGLMRIDPDGLLAKQTTRTIAVVTAPAEKPPEASAEVAQVDQGARGRR